MTPEDHLICLLARQNFECHHLQAALDLLDCTPVDWPYIFSTSHSHQMSPLVWANLHENASSEQDHLPVPSRTLDSFKQAYIHNVIVKKQTLQVLSDALDILDAFGLESMLVKGEALNLTVYRKPWYTISHDVDLVIRAPRASLEPRVQVVLDEALNGLNGGTLREHLEFDYYAHHDVTMNGIMRFDIERVWREAQPVEIGRHTVYLMTPEDTLLAAAVQCCRKRFFRLKSICDLAEIVATQTDLDWRLAVSKAREYHCNVVLYTSLRVAQLLLGSDVPEGVLGNLGVGHARASLIERIVASLIERSSLAELHARSEGRFLGRRYSPALALTYASYRVDQLPAKMGEIYSAWRKPNGNLW